MGHKAAGVELIPLTVTMLEALGRGEQITYYFGNFEADMRRCDPLSGDAGAPKYKEALRAVKDAAWSLAQRKRIRLSELAHPDRRGSQQPRMIEYTAVGLAS